MATPLHLDNIVFHLQRSGGISAYWYELCQRLLPDRDFNCLFYEYTEAPVNIFRQLLDIPADHRVPLYRPRPLERYLPIKLRQPIGVFHSSYYRHASIKSAAKQVVTVHDFTYEKMVPGFRKQVHVWQKKQAIANADIVICISENTRKDLCELYPAFARKDIRVIYNGVSEHYYPLSEKVAPAQPYILWVGARDSYKNFPFAVRWISGLKGYELKIAGAPLSPAEELLLSEKLAGRYSYAGTVDNSTLNLLYNQAACLIYPSSYEGFGIPVIEAMRAGCPVLALNTSSLPEVCGDAGLMASHLDPEIMTGLLRLVEENRSAIVEKGFAQAAKFSWNKCYEETSRIYKELLS